MLIADDEVVVRNALGRNLLRLGCDVVLAQDGEEALRKALDIKPAVVFLDLRMPGLDGYMLLRALPDSGVQASVVVMSGQANVDDVIDALRMGAVDFLKKPWSTNELVAALARGVEVFRSIDAGEGARLKGHAALARLPLAALSSTARLDPAREKLLDRLQSREIALPGPPSAFSVTCAPLHRCACDLAASNQAATPLSTDEIVRLVEGDPRLGTAVLRLANSRLYPDYTPTEYLGVAVSRIGAPLVHAVAETLALRAGYPIRPPELRQLHIKIWRFSVARGLAMRALADVAGPEVALDADRCYLAGLLLDVGVVFLLWTLAESRRAAGGGGSGTAGTGTGTGDAGAPVLAAAGPPTIGTTNAQILSTYHPAFSQGILSRWGMGEDLVTLARDHHTSALALPHAPLWSVAQLARPLAARVVGFDDPSCLSPRPSAEILDRCAYQLGVGETVLRRLATTLADDARTHWEIYE